jgi:hypothetical protein
MSKTFQTYLLERGRTNASDAEKKLLFKEFRHEVYLKEKNVQRKTKGKRVEILTPFELDTKIEHLAKRLGISKSKLILQILGYYFNITWIYPHKNLLSDIRIELGKIDSKYYQLIHFCYTKNNIYQKQIERLLKLQQIQKDEILDKLSPRALEDYFFEMLSDSEFVKRVETTIDHFKSKTK